jgi:hypothetical protein
MATVMVHRRGLSLAPAVNDCDRSSIPVSNKSAIIQQFAEKFAEELLTTSAIRNY